MFGFIGRLFARRSGARLESASCSDRGKVREENQDSVLVREDCAVYCVADGMGGGEGGAKASSILCECVSDSLDRRLDFAGVVKALAGAVHEANAKIRDFAAKAGYRQMATTATMLAFRRGDAACAVIGYVGDSRVYRFRDGAVERLTHDHTLAGELGRRTLSKRTAGALGGYAGRLSHILTRAVGIEDDVQTEWRKIDVRDGDVFIVCTDGVYNMVRDSAMARILSASAGPREAVANISKAVSAAGAEDNFSMIAIRAGGAK